MRTQPSSASAQRDAARNHTKRAYSERNELLRVFCRLWEAHTMPVSGALSALDKRRVLCIHSPVGTLAYVLSDAEFSDFDVPHVNASHWDGCTRAQRSERLEAITAHKTDTLVKDAIAAYRDLSRGGSKRKGNPASGR